MDNKALLDQLEANFTNLELKIRQSNLTDRMQLQPQLDKAKQDYDEFQARLISGAIIVSDADLPEMAKIKQAIENAAQKEELAEAIVQTAAFIAKRMV